MRRLQEGAVGEKLRPTGDRTVQWSSLALPDLTANRAGSLSVIYTGNIYIFILLPLKRWQAGCCPVAWAQPCPTSVPPPHGSAQLSPAQEVPGPLQKEETFRFLAES